MKKELGIYIHIPFCKQKCYYCDFVSFSDKIELQEKYFYQKGVLAVSVVKPFLAHGESTCVYQVFSNASSTSSGESFDE